jgi:integrase
MTRENPCSEIVDVLRPVPPATPVPALLDLTVLQKMLAMIEGEPASPLTKLANRFTARTLMRTFPVRHATWDQFHLGTDARWEIPGRSMKGSLARPRDFSVPLTHQAVETLNTLRTLTGSCRFVFANARSSREPMTENAMSAMINRAGYKGKHCPYGWRASFSTIMNERRPQDRAIIDFALGHISKDKVERVYNRAGYLTQRREIQQDWADLLLACAVAPQILLALPRR